MSLAFRASAVLAASVLVVSTSAGVANAQSEDLGNLSAEGIGSVTGSLPADGDFGSISFEPGQPGSGSVDTSGSALLEEPTTGVLAGSLAEAVDSINEAAGSNAINPAPETGSVDTTGSLTGEPTTGALAPFWGPIGNALGSGQGNNLVIGSEDGSGSLGTILVVGGVAAAIGAGIAFAPQIEQALADAGIELPPLP